MVTSGTRVFSDVLTGRRAYFLRDKIQHLIGDVGLFAMILMGEKFPKAKRIMHYDPDISWAEQDALKSSFVAGTVSAWPVVPLSVAGDYKYFKVGDTVEEENDRHTYRVSAVDTVNNTITLVATDGASTVSTGDYLKILGPGNTAIATAGDGKNEAENERKQAMQIFDHVIEADYFTANAVLQGVDKNTRDSMRRNALIELARKIERSWLYGEYKSDAANSLWLCEGIYKQIYSRGGTVVDHTSGGANTALTKGKLWEFLTALYQYGTTSGKPKVVMASNEWIGSVMGLGLTNLQMAPNIEVFGVNFKKVDLMGKTIYLYESREMDDSLGATVPGYKNMAIGFDIDDLEIYSFPIEAAVETGKYQNTDLVLLQNIQGNDSLVRKDQLLYIGTPVLRNVKRHAVHWGIKNDLA